MTGAGSWYLLTVICEMFGIKGDAGDLRIEPKLMKSQFDPDGKASVAFPFAGCDFTASFINSGGKDYGEYRIGKALVDGDKELSAEGSFVQITAAQLGELGSGAHVIEVELV